MTTVEFRAPRPGRTTEVCPDTCRRGGASAIHDYAWYCGSCGRLREDMNEPERQAVQRYLDSDEYAWLIHYGLPTKNPRDIAWEARHR